MQAFGVEAEDDHAAEAQEKWPLLNVDDVVGAIFYPKDGKCNPADTTMALARGARMGGQDLRGYQGRGHPGRERRAPSASTTDGGRDQGRGGGDCRRHVVARDRAQARRQHAAPCLRAFLYRHRADGLPSNLPVMRDMDACAYYKEDAGKLLIGAFEPKAKPWGMDGIPRIFCFDELPEDFDHFQPILEGAIHRVPSLEKVGIRKFFNGPESFTADQRYILGEAPELKNFFVAAGFNSIGIQSARRRRHGARRIGSPTASRRSISGTSTSAACRRIRAARASLRPRVGGAGPALCHALALSPVRNGARHQR